MNVFKVRRRTPLPKFSTLRKEKVTRPVSTTFLDTYRHRDYQTPKIPSHGDYQKSSKTPNYGDYQISKIPNYGDSYLSRRAVPLCTPDDLLDIIRDPAGYYVLPTDPCNEVFPNIYLSDA